MSNERVARSLGALLAAGQAPDPKLELSQEARVALLLECAGKMRDVGTAPYRPNDIVDFLPHLGTLDIPGPYVVVEHYPTPVPRREGVNPGTFEYLAQLNLKVGCIADDGTYIELLVDSRRVRKV